MTECAEPQTYAVTEAARVYRFIGWADALPAGTHWIEGQAYTDEPQLIEIIKVKKEESND